MTTERQWVNGFIEKLEKELRKTSQKDFVMSASDGTKVAYACEIQSYGSDDEPVVTTNKYDYFLFLDLSNLKEPTNLG